MILTIDEVWLPEAERLRGEDNYGDIEKLAARMETLGQLQYILVAPTPPEEKDAASGRPWKVVDGGRRWTAVALLSERDSAPRGLAPRQIGAIVEGEALDPFNALLREFYANNDRLDFTWQERCEFVRRVHSLRRAEVGKVWSVEMTATVLGMSPESVYKYLQISAAPEVLNAPEVQASDSFTTAYKKATILRQRKKREIAVTTSRPSSDGDDESASPDDGEREWSDADTRLDLTARSLYTNADAREWINEFPASTFDFIHWDPPYGGDQDGGPFASKERIDDSLTAASALWHDLLPRLHEKLKDGHWMIFWFYPPFAERIRHLLQGHAFTVGRECYHCKKLRDTLDLFKRCPKAPWGFWVNPHPNIWHKQNRHSDGHEITRFLLNQTEMFYLCAKWEKEEPTLMNSSRSNIFSFDVTPRSERRHVMHKPPALIAEVLRLISLPGELGCDPTAGSGSSVEAALDSGRRLLAAELSETIWLDSIGAIKEKLRLLGVTSLRDLRKPEPVEGT